MTISSAWQVDSIALCWEGKSVETSDVSARG